MAPKEVLRPTRPFHAAGIRTEPPVSEPTATGASRRATETAAPLDDPPGARGVSVATAFAGVPVAGLEPMPPRAN